MADIEYDPATEGVVYAAMWGGLFYSPDSGHSWLRWPGNIGLVPIYSVSAQALNTTESVVYVGTVGGSADTSQAAVGAEAASNVVRAGAYLNVIGWSRAYLPAVRRQ